MAFNMSNLLGPQLTNAAGENINTSTLDNAAAVGLYFSAHWCPPCRMFTPQLAKWYPNLRDNKNFPIVFVSSDRDANQYTEYLKEMPWLALPFADRERKAKLAGKFKVEGIPMLVIVDPKTGKAINVDGREAVSKDPQGANFPWPAPTLKQLLQPLQLVSSSGSKPAAEALQNKVVGVYFSAHWCGPCREFTPKLIALYNKLREAGKNFEVVFVSSDRDEASFKNYHGSMPWLAVPFAEEDAREALSSFFGVRGIPHLAIYDAASDKVINDNARGTVGADLEGANFPWLPRDVHLLNESGVGDLQKNPAVVAFGVEEAKGLQVFQAVAAPLKAAAEAKDEDIPYKFFVSTNHPISERVRGLMKAEGKTLGILDLSSGTVALSDVSAADFSEAVVTNFLNNYESGNVQRVSLQ